MRLFDFNVGLSLTRVNFAHIKTLHTQYIRFTTFSIQGIIDFTETETRQIFSRMSVTKKKLKRCLPLPEMNSC